MCFTCCVLPLHFVLKSYFLTLFSLSQISSFFNFFSYIVSFQPFRLFSRKNIHAQFISNSTRSLYTGIEINQSLDVYTKVFFASLFSFIISLYCHSFLIFLSFFTHLSLFVHFSVLILIRRWA